MPFRRQPDQRELAARIRAAQAYARLERSDMAAALGTTPSTLDRKLGKRAETSELTWADAWAAAAATGLPDAFFGADFTRLHEVTPVDVPLPAQRERAGPIQRARTIARRAGRRQPESPRASSDTQSDAGDGGTVA